MSDIWLHRRQIMWKTGCHSVIPGNTDGDCRPFISVIHEFAEGGLEKAENVTSTRSPVQGDKHMMFPRDAKGRVRVIGSHRPLHFPPNHGRGK